MKRKRQMKHMWQAAEEMQKTKQEKKQQDVANLLTPFTIRLVHLPPSL